MKMMKTNDIYKNDPKQVQLLKISKITLQALFIVGGPLTALSITAGLLRNNLLIEIGNFPMPYLKLVMTISNFAIDFNKSRAEREICIVLRDCF